MNSLDEDVFLQSMAICRSRERKLRARSARST
jgi:hypothetical protein